MKIGEAIKKLRIERGATQEDVALEAGTNAGNLSRIERCQQQPALELVEKIAAALGTSHEPIIRTRPRRLATPRLAASRAVLPDVHRFLVDAQLPPALASP